MARNVRSPRQEERRGKKTKKVLVPRSENTRAQRTYLLLIGLMIWAGTISVAGIIKLLYVHGPLDPLAAMLELIIYFCFIVGLIGILKVKPPLHYLIPVGAAINLIPSYFAGQYGYALGMISVLILYIAIRFPIHFEWEKRILEK